MESSDYQQWIRTNGHLPTGLSGVNHSEKFASIFLKKELLSNETLVDITGVRYRGKNTFLILTTKRLICASTEEKYTLNLTKYFDSLFSLDLKHIKRLSLAPSNGLIVEVGTTKHNLYYVQQSTGQLFSESFTGLVNNIETLATIPADGYEKGVMLQGILSLFIIIGLFGGCVYRLSSGSTSPSTINSVQECDQQAVTKRIAEEIGPTIDNEAEIEYARRRIKEECGY